MKVTSAPALRQRRAVAAADATRSDYRDTHSTLPITMRPATAGRDDAAGVFDLQAAVGRQAVLLAPAAAAIAGPAAQ